MCFFIYKHKFMLIIRIMLFHRMYLVTNLNKTDDENDVIKMKTETTVFICRSEEEEEREMMNEILKDVWKVGNYDVIVKSELKDYLEKPGMVYASYELIAESYKAGALQSQNKMGINEFIPMISFLDDKGR